MHVDVDKIVPVVVRSNNGWFEVRWVSKRAKGMRGMVCLLYSHTSRPHFPRRAGSASTVAAAGDPVATVATDIQLLVVKANLGSGEEDGCVRLQNLLEMWIEPS